MTTDPWRAAPSRASQVGSAGSLLARTMPTSSGRRALTASARAAPTSASVVTGTSVTVSGISTSEDGGDPTTARTIDRANAGVASAAAGAAGWT